MKHMKLKIMIPLLLIVGVLIISILPDFIDTSSGDLVHARVIGSADSSSKGSQNYSNVKIKILDGAHKNEIITVQNIVNENIKSESGSRENFVEKNDEVLVSIQEDNKANIKSAYIYEIVKYRQLYFLIFVFAAAVIFIGGKKGLKSLLSLVITGFAVLKLLLPLILAGFNPVAVSVVLCIGISILNLIIISGKNKKTLAAIIGTCSGVVLSGIIALYFIYNMKLKGFSDDELQMLIFTSQNSNFDYRGLLFAGILMGALGAVMDVSISIASSMNEIALNNNETSFKSLFTSGMNVGKDIMGSMANTLILAYAGGAIYTLLLISSYNMTISRILDQDLFASEILKSICGSLGLVFTIPLTALAYAALCKRKPKES
ncbi:YibE/F family protein [Clostridium sp. 19966]|uniref:YibE/F family protein n=1 Tax=Clostridium sp. 19966 TaxID=2768166 RepID=UPI0028DFB496|nr:YibE/F family protein [Clostridium sp. 19966]MDT8717977.1 YibE/F family protein [Clostridium sp. 19966]